MSKATIMVAEDDWDLREALCDTLELAGFRVVPACSAEEALLLLADKPVDMLVSDVNMGEIDGYELLQRLRVQMPTLPVLLITAYGSISKSVEAMRNGAVDYLVKPFDPQTLVAAVRQYVSAPTRINEDDPVAEEPGLFVYNDMYPNSDRLKQIYFDSDIFCLPTFGDCLPMVLSEAGAAGLPVVSTRVAGIPELVHEGETGLLVKAGDQAALTNALEILVKYPDQRLQQGEKAVQVITEGFDAALNAVCLLDLLKGVIHG